MTSQQAKAEVNSRVMVVGTLALYGTIGGALLGTASLAYGLKPRAIAIGASLGLYVGILFGAYIVASHSYRNAQREGESYQSTEPTYQDQEAGDGFGVGDEEGGGDAGAANRWNPYYMHMQYRYLPSTPHQRFFLPKNEVRTYIPLLNYQF